MSAGSDKDKTSNAADGVAPSITATPASVVIDDATQLFHVGLASVYEGHPDDERFGNMPRCTTKALVELLMDDDAGDDIQFRAERRLAATTMAALAEALVFARNRLVTGNKVDEAHVRGIDKLLAGAGIVLSGSRHMLTSETDVALTQPPARPAKRSNNQKEK